MWILLLFSCTDPDTHDSDSDPSNETEEHEEEESEEKQPVTGLIEPDVVHYDYHFDSSNQAANATVQINAPDGGDCVTLDYRAGEPEQAWWDDEPIEWETGEDNITLCGTALPPGSTLEVGVDLTVEEQSVNGSDVGYNDHGDLRYLVSWVEGCDMFGPCNADPATFATFAFHVDHESGDTVLCPGELEAGDTQSHCTLDVPAPTYSAFGFAIDNRWEKVDMGDGLVIYDLERANFTDEFDAESVLGFRDWMADLAGPYPYGEEIRFFAADTYWAGFEHPGNVAMSDNLDGNASGYYANGLRHVALHEVAHMWAGNQVTLASRGNFAWKEASAEYLSYVYEDEVLSDGDGNTQYWKWLADRADVYPFPNDPGPLFEWYGDAYGAGPMILFRQLEALYGREVILDALSTLLFEQAAVSLDDIRVILEAATGETLTAYFETWARGDGAPQWPEVSVEVTKDGLVTVTQSTSDGQAWPCAFDVRIHDEKGTSQDLRITFAVGGKSLVFSDTLPDPITFPIEIEVDPAAEALVYEADNRTHGPTPPFLGWF